MPLVMMLRSSLSRTASPGAPSMARAGAPPLAASAITWSAPWPAHSSGVRSASRAMAPMMATSVKASPRARAAAAACMSAALAVVKSA